MEYITNTRFKSQTMSGYINLPYGTICEESEKIIYYKNKPLCYITSQNAYDYFSRNDDNQGLKRGKIIKNIIKTLSKRDENYQNRWDRLWNNSFALRFKRKEHENFWVWNCDFYNANIEDLEEIEELIK